MSEQQNDGGRAFPGEQGKTNDGQWNQTWDCGMSLRDYFAAAALNGELAADLHFGVGGEGGKTREQYLAIHAYEIADAMIAERAKK